MVGFSRITVFIFCMHFAQILSAGDSIYFEQLLDTTLKEDIYSSKFNSNVAELLAYYRNGDRLNKWYDFNSALVSIQGKKICPSTCIKSNWRNISV